MGAIAWHTQESPLEFLELKKIFGPLLLFYFVLAKLVKFWVCQTHIKTYLTGDLAPYNHCTILIEIPLSSKADQKNDLGIAPMHLTNSQISQLGITFYFSEYFIPFTVLCPTLLAFHKIYVILLLESDWSNSKGNLQWNWSNAWCQYYKKHFFIATLSLTLWYNKLECLPNNSLFWYFCVRLGACPESWHLRVHL